MANILAMENEKTNFLLNIGTGESITILELAEMILEISKLDLKPVFDPPLEGDIEKSQADITLAKELLKWKPGKKLSDWLSEIL